MAATVTRDNGKIYRRRGPLQVQEYSTVDCDTGVAVLGTHTIAEAAALAAGSIAEYDLDNVTPTLRWWRKVPWDTSGDSGWSWSWIEDPVRGTPAVVWDPS